MVVPWTSDNAAHLLRRAGFAATTAQVKKALKSGLTKTVKDLFGKDKSSDKLPGYVTGLNALQFWWLERMATTNSPLTEKLTLFWHNHFATAMDKVGSVTRMHNQNRTMRKFAMGRFRDLVLEMSRDPAMIRWLDNNTNVKGKPNENYARELMELFTTGVFDHLGQSNYTEQDVAEAARAFTGWTTSDDKFFFAEWNHDFGSKTFRGQTGAFDGTDIVDLLVVDPATARRVAMKLWSFFAYEVDLADPIVAELADVYLENDTSIRAVLEAMFQHDAFYAAPAHGARVKSPAEYVVNLTRLLSAKLKPEDWSRIASTTTAMGQALFNPPTVFGWKEGLAWVGAAGMLERVTASEDLTSERGKEAYFSYKPATLLGSKKNKKKLDAAGTVDTVLAGLGPMHVSDTTRAALTDYLLADDAGQPQDAFALDSATIDKKVRGLISIAVSLPEFQVH